MVKYYKFEAMDSRGMEHSDVVTAESEAEAQAKVRQMGYFITKISLAKEVLQGNVPMENGYIESQAPVRYVTMTQFKRFQLVMIAIIAVACMLAMVAISNGQEPTLRAVPTGISQTVTVNHNYNIRAFRRERLEANWSDWIEWAPMRSDEKSKIFKPRPVNQEFVTKLMGHHILKWLSQRPPVSGNYNFSGNKNYDFRKYAGDKYGTWMMPPPIRKKQ